MSLQFNAFFLLYAPAFFTTKYLSCVHQTPHTSKSKYSEWLKGRKKSYREMAPKNLQLFKDEQIHIKCIVCLHTQNTKVGQMFKNQIQPSQNFIFFFWCDGVEKDVKNHTFYNKQ